VSIKWFLVLFLVFLKIPQSGKGNQPESFTKDKPDMAEVSSLQDEVDEFEEAENVKYQNPHSKFGILEDSQEYSNPNLILPQPTSEADFDEEIATFDNCVQTQRGIQ